ncbi:MAG: hypothetical protein COT39_03130 [Parcubacteria group bacterium CG08_land_8_20_14_0_20_48_21]|nr:MAG: hypothetical protein AUK21_04345 [Parcubacteria group bacterium CG2_30_48_51]PIS32668.1 MAG: hypothetical protein COT39_03130 [Parcubacteria group bacterium CG08_land_8_20_14_0_20_48_21]PIW79009.1 MAG: hypothetical protein COZ99_03230 [Parcubacteria group bacterium CG_4_8_14_3_um_filter_48_16]PIY77946.1 MAG: hypothetical protein COY83_02370 [Parcubacteria group bacterium CG_4_10_14_0_8_um_filter_48_154]PIZ77548.1 MAG: hypothetical protein COY03_02370 [bacterium CG_4_10_14_0_2_um_filter_
MQKSMILVIEDDVALREMLVEKLRKAGYAAQSAEDGVVGLEKMRNTLPDLVLLDILMPRKDGMQVLEEKAKDTAIKNLPVIIISNSGQPVEIERAKKLGAKDFLIKAIFNPSEVLEKVAHVLEVLPNKTDAAQGTARVKAQLVSILIVEDDQFLRELIAQKLLGEGYNVESVIDAHAAYAALEQHVPDAILLDIILPGESGFVILEKLKGDTRFASIPVLVLSNLGQREDMEKAMRLGAKDFLIKANFTPEEIVRHIQQAVKD